MQNKQLKYIESNEELIVAWEYCEQLEQQSEDYHASINHLIKLLDRYKIDYHDVDTVVENAKNYDCQTCDAKKAWDYYEYLERQNRKLDKVLKQLNKLLFSYGLEHPEIVNDPGIIWM